MKDQRLREMMGKLYRLIEKYEEPPKAKNEKDTLSYFEAVGNDCALLYDENKGNEFAQELLFGLYTAISKRYKAANIDKASGGNENEL